MRARCPIAMLLATGGLAAGVVAGQAALAPRPALAAHPAALAPRPALAAHPPARLLVYAQEWSLWPSRTRLAPGAVSVQLWNRGQDPHNLRIQRLRGGEATGRVQGVATTSSGALATATWHLAPGAYELYCSLAGHAHAGMRTRLIVR